MSQNPATPISVCNDRSPPSHMPCVSQNPATPISVCNDRGPPSHMPCVSQNPATPISVCNDRGPPSHMLCVSQNPATPISVCNDRGPPSHMPCVSQNPATPISSELASIYGSPPQVVVYCTPQVYSLLVNSWQPQPFSAVKYACQVFVFYVDSWLSTMVDLVYVRYVYNIIYMIW